MHGEGEDVCLVTSGDAEVGMESEAALLPPRGRPCAQTGDIGLRRRKLKPDGSSIDLARVQESELHSAAVDV